MNVILLSYLSLSFNSNYFVEQTINFPNLDPRVKNVCLLNTIDTSTEHSKALYYNMSKVLDIEINNLNSWTIPYDVNYIPSLGTNFNLIFTENEITTDYFKNSDIDGYYYLSPAFTINSDKEIKLEYNSNKTIFQPGENESFTLSGFRNTVLVELLSRQDDYWFVFPSMQRFIMQRFINNINDTDTYYYDVVSSLQNYFRIDFKLRFTELLNDNPTTYSLETNEFNIPGFYISDYNIDFDYIQLIIDYAHFNGTFGINVINTVSGTNIEYFKQTIVNNSLNIPNNYLTGNYSFNICALENLEICNTIDLSLYRNLISVIDGIDDNIGTNGTNNGINNGTNNGTNNGINNGDDTSIEITNGIEPVHIAIICIVSFFVAVILYIVSCYFYTTKSSQVHPQPVYVNKRSDYGYNTRSHINNVYENPKAAVQHNYSHLDDSRIYENRHVNNYNVLQPTPNRTLINEIYHITEDYKQNYRV